MSTTKKDNDNKKGQEAMSSSTKPGTSSGRTGEKKTPDQDEKQGSRNTATSRGNASTKADRDKDTGRSSDMDEDTNTKNR